jgi:uncharacterized DUF497 family protein
VKIVWDEPKRLANLDKHGLDFADLDETFFDSALVVPSRNAGKRWVAIGVSIISMRPASRNERKLYDERQKTSRL